METKEPVCKRCNDTKEIFRNNYPDDFVKVSCPDCQSKEPVGGVSEEKKKEFEKETKNIEKIKDTKERLDKLSEGL